VQEEKDVMAVAALAHRKQEGGAQGDAGKGRRGGRQGGGSAAVGDAQKVTMLLVAGGSICSWMCRRRESRGAREG
jgi:hypothetical protein